MNKKQFPTPKNPSTSKLMSIYCTAHVVPRDISATLANFLNVSVWEDSTSKLTYELSHGETKEKTPSVECPLRSLVAHFTASEAASLAMHFFDRVMLHFIGLRTQESHSFDSASSENENYLVSHNSIIAAIIAISF